MKTRRKTTGAGRRGGGTGENLVRARARERERESKTQQHGAPENSPSAVAHFKQHTHTHTLHRDSCTARKSVGRLDRRRKSSRKEAVTSEVGSSGTDTSNTTEQP